MTGLPLSGRRVVVTRAEEQAASLADGLRQRGAVPLLVPSISFVPPEDPGPLRRAARQIDRAAWVVFTSATGVAFGWGAIREAWPGGLPEGVRVAAIGTGTEDAAREAGAPVHFVPREALGDVLVDELPLESGDRIVLLRSDIGRPSIAQRLERRGADVRDVTAYRTLTHADPQAVADALRQRPDAITFTSPSTVRGFLGTAGLADGLREAGSPALVAIGPVTAEALEPFGLSADAIAEPHTVAGLLATLETLFA